MGIQLQPNVLRVDIPDFSLPAAAPKAPAADTQPRLDAFVPAAAQLAEAAGDLTGQDAARVQWSRMAEVVAENTAAPAVPEEPEQQEAQQQKQVDWEPMEGWAPDSGRTLEENMNELLMRYQKLRLFIVANFSGPTQKQLLSELGDLLTEKLDDLQKLQLQELYAFLAEHGQESAAGSIRPSLRLALISAAQTQSAPKSSAQAQTPPEQRSGASKSADTARFTQAARAASTQSAAASREAAPAAQLPTVFSPRDLRQAARLLRHLEPAQLPQSQETGAAKALLPGLNTGILTMKAEAFARYAHVSPQMASVMQKAVEQFAAAYLRRETPGEAAPRATAARDASPEAVADRPQAPRASTPDEGGALPPLSERDAKAVAQRMLSAFRKSGDAKEAVLEGARMAHELISQREKSSGSGRPHSEEAFWNNLLRGSGDQSAAGRWSPLQIIRQDWNVFIKGMELYQSRNGDLLFGAFSTGAMQMRPTGLGGLPVQGAIGSAAMVAFSVLPPLFMAFTGQSPTAVLSVLGADLCAVGLLLWTFKKNR